MDTPPVPFELAGGTYGGLGECFGLLRWDGDRLILEYQVRTLFRILKGETKTLPIQLSDVAGITWRKGLMNGRLQLRLKTMAAAGDLPLQDGALILHIKRPHRSAAADLALHYELLVSGELHRKSRELLEG